MNRVPMDIVEAETLARAGVAGRVSTALLLALDEARAQAAALAETNRQLLVAAQAIGEGARSGYIPRAWEGDH